MTFSIRIPKVTRTSCCLMDTTICQSWMIISNSKKCDSANRWWVVWTLRTRISRGNRLWISTTTLHQEIRDGMVINTLLVVKIYRWTTRWSLSLNLSSTETIQTSHRRRIKIRSSSQNLLSFLKRVVGSQCNGVLRLRTISRFQSFAPPLHPISSGTRSLRGRRVQWNGCMAPRTPYLQNGSMNTIAISDKTSAGSSSVIAIQTSRMMQITIGSRDFTTMLSIKG